MLTNLDWLQEGAAYPPVSEKTRIEQYKTNERLFMTEHSEVWKQVFEAIARRIKRKTSEVETIFNYHQMLSKKTADFVCGEPPTIETAQDTDALKKILDGQKWVAKLYEAIIDVSRFGNAVPKIVDKRLTAVSPKYWLPIVDQNDLKEIVQHVIAYPVAPDAKGKMTALYVEIHDKGKITTQRYAFDADRQIVGKKTEPDKIEDTGLDDFAVLPLTNLTTSSSVFGIDDYAVVNSIVSKIMWRVACIDRVLDKHSEPSLSGPGSALELDPRTGMYFLNLGNYFRRNNETDPDVKYLTWDGNLDSSFKEIELLFNQLYTLSEMGQAFSEAAGGTADSGEALKLRMVSPRIKASRIVNLNADTVKKIIVLLAGINGLAIDYDGLTLHWNDGLPQSEKEQIETLSAATGGKPVMSQYAAMKRMGLSDDEVEDELEQIAEETAAQAPVFLRSIDSAATGKTEPPQEDEAHTERESNRALR